MKSKLGAPLGICSLRKGLVIIALNGTIGPGQGFRHTPFGDGRADEVQGFMGKSLSGRGWAPSRRTGLRAGFAVAAGLQTVLEEGTFARLVVSRPIFPLGRDVGYLPGTLEEKLNPWMQPIFDNLEYIFTSARRRMMDHRDYHELVASGTLQIEPLTYIRGRSLPNQYLIVDEAQNLTPHEVKTVITRAGQNTKIVLTGDPDQIDNPYVDSASNGLTIVAERFRTEKIGAHVTLVKGERSELAERATQLL